MERQWSPEEVRRTRAAPGARERAIGKWTAPARILETAGRFRPADAMPGSVAAYAGVKRRAVS